MAFMSGYAPFDGLTATAIALAILLSALVSVIGTSARRRMVALGEARVQDLSEMTGISDPSELQDTFGPPDMGRVWRTVTLLDVRQARRPLGWLISSDLVDWACMAIAALSFFVRDPLMNVALLMALAAQVGGWVAASRLPK